MGIATAGGWMKRESKRDLAAAGAILTMFLGASILAVTMFGLVLIAGGAVAMLVFMFNALRKDP
jgi:hypothetical protein